VFMLIAGESAGILGCKGCEGKGCMVGGTMLGCDRTCPG